MSVSQTDFKKRCPSLCPPCVVHEHHVNETCFKDVAQVNDSSLLSESEVIALLTYSVRFYKKKYINVYWHSFCVVMGNHQRYFMAVKT